MAPPDQSELDQSDETRCPNGHTNDPGLAYCTTCGAPIGRSCPNGHPVAPNDTYCGDCGRAVDLDTAEKDADDPRRRWLPWAILATVAVLAITGWLILRSDGDSPDAVTESTESPAGTTSATSSTTSTSTTTTLDADAEAEAEAEGGSTGDYSEEESLAQEVLDAWNAGTPDAASDIASPEVILALATLRPPGDATVTQCFFWDDVEPNDYPTDAIFYCAATYNEGSIPLTLYLNGGASAGYTVTNIDSAGQPISSVIDIDEGPPVG